MALLFNIVSFSSHENRVNSPLFLSLIIFLSYLATSHTHNSSEMYIYYVYADILTIALISIYIYYTADRYPAQLYCILALVFNACLFLYMHIDLHVNGNVEPWWFWTFYSFGINVADTIIIVSLIINKDFLGLCRIGRFLKAFLAPKKVGDNG